MPRVGILVVTLHLRVSGKDGVVTDDDSFRNFIEPYLGPGQRERFLNQCMHLSGDCSDKSFVEDVLQAKIDSLSKNGGEPLDRLFYFSMPWQLFSKVRDEGRIIRKSVR